MDSKLLCEVMYFMIARKMLESNYISFVNLKRHIHEKIGMSRNYMKWKCHTVLLKQK